MISATDLGRIGDQELPTARARQVMSRRVLRTYPDESLYQAWLRMTRSGVRQLAVVNRAEPDRLVGVLTARAVAQLLRLPTTARSAPQAGEASASSRTETQESAATSPLERQPMTRPVESEQGVSARDLLETTRVAEVMLATPRLIRESDPLVKARELLEERGAALLVVDEEARLVGIITRVDLHERKDHEHGRRLTVGDVAVRNLVTARPAESLYAAVRRMSQLGLRQLPVVDANLPTHPVGMLRRSDVLAVYTRERGREMSSSSLPSTSSSSSSSGVTIPQATDDEDVEHVEDGEP